MFIKVGLFSATIDVIILGWHQCVRHDDGGRLPGKQTQH